MAVTSVQILGIDNVLRAYDNKDAVKWSCWQGKTMNEFYDGDSAEEGRERLLQWLKMISPFSQAIYTLKFYSDDVTKIRSTTEDVGGFNFRLYEDDRSQYEVPARRVGRAGNDDAFIAILEKMDARMEKLEEKVSGPEPEKLEAWEKVLDHPLALAACAKIFGLDASLLQSEAIGGVPGQPGSIDESIAILKKSDAQLELHLHKLAMLAQSNAAQFNMLIGMLDKM